MRVVVSLRSILGMTASIGLLSLITVDVRAADALPDFVDHVKPILTAKCASCHGSSKQKSGFRIDVREIAMKGGESGHAAIIPGKSVDSPLFQLVSQTDPGRMMPPAESGIAPLSKEELAILQKWIDAGALWPDSASIVLEDPRNHWAFQPIKRPNIPNGQQETPTNGNLIDCFVALGLKQAQLEMSPEADRRELIRRLSFDLLGLPPSPEDIHAFNVDDDPAAYEKLVDRLLASPHYGERWARHWLDISHYADTHGFERDQRRDNAYRYRDWVVNALNSDLPYDQFLREQIAGDVIHPHRPDSIIATGFLAAGPWDFVGQAETPSPTLKRLARADDLDDMVTQVMTAACGVTVNCARCHDHKLDPISQREYYSLWAVFAGVKRGDRDIDRVEARELAEKKGPLVSELDQVKMRLANLDAKGAEISPVEKTEAEQLRKKLAELELAIKSLPTPARVYAVNGEVPAPIKVLRRGNTEDELEETLPAALAFGGKYESQLTIAVPANEGERRLAIANWIVSKSNPLTRRVIMNRLWHYHFGTGIVDTPSDFGVGGGRPSHPELLDWLAEEFADRGWSLKAIHRLMVTSATYRQCSASRDSSNDAETQSRIQRAINLDEGNRKLWRMSPRRLDAESLRDAVLAVSGQLNTTMHGPGYRDFEYFEEYAPVYRYVTPDRPELWRRSIYRFVVRTTPHQFLTTLDCANPANMTPVRNVTTTSLQSLAMLHNDFIVRQSTDFALRVEAEVGTDSAAQVRHAFQLALGRVPSSDESEAAQKLVRSVGLPELCRMLFNLNEFVYVD